jgi:AcrR family transcriptional regulator
MGTKERKAREFAAREQSIITAARKLLKRDGYLGFNLDLVADGAELAKGTLYKHFTSKEDLLMAIVTQTAERRARWWERIAQLPLTARERMYGLLIADAHLARGFPGYFENAMLLEMKSFRESISEARHQAAVETTGRAMAIVFGLLQEAIRKGELSISEESMRLFAGGSAAMCIGVRLFDRRFEDVIGSDIEDGLLDLYGRLADSFGWTPMRSKIDIPALRTLVEPLCSR